MKSNIENRIRRMFAVMALVMLFIAIATPAGAAGLMDSDIYKNTKRLLTDAGTVGLILCPSICGLAALYFLIRRAMASEEKKRIWSERMTTAIICGACGGLISGMIALIADYFG